MLLVLAALGLLPAAAGASTSQLAIFQDDAKLLQSGDGVREATLNELRELGVDVIKAQLAWADVAPGGKRKPKGFDGSDPAQYPGWERYDAFVRDAQARGFRVMFALSPPHPGWATKRRGDLAGPSSPSAREFGRFAEAAGKRFTSVDIWAIGNEPNHPEFLFPQSKRGLPVAPHAYRSMVRASVTGLHRAGHTSDTILFGELLPIGKSGSGPKLNLQPIRFLREFFCLDSRWRPFRGTAAKRRGCQRYRKLTGVTGFGYHPYTRAGGPRIQEPSSDDATIGSLGRIGRALDIARRNRRIGGPRQPLWITEFDFESNPPDNLRGAQLRKIPAFMGESELWIALRNRRVKSYSQYTMTDTPLGPGGYTGHWQGGLRFSNEKPKRGVYDAYRLPLFVRQLGPRAVEVRGAARPQGAGAVVQVQQRLGRRGEFDDLGGPITVQNERGYFVARFRVSKAGKRTVRFRAGSHTSAEIKAVFRR